MFRKLRELVDRSPRTGWLLAAMFLVAGILVFVRLRGSAGGYTYEHMSQDVRIRCAETGDEWTVKRGEMERDLLMRAGQIKPSEGLVNPKTGKPTGFPVDEWQATIDRLNAEKAALATGRRGNRAPASK